MTAIQTMAHAKDAEFAERYFVLRVLRAIRVSICSN